MADKRVLMFVDIDEAIVSLFTHYCLCFDLLNDNDVNIKQNINCFSEKIKDYLIDRYNLDAEIVDNFIDELNEEVKNA